MIKEVLRLHRRTPDLSPPALSVYTARIRVNNERLGREGYRRGMQRRLSLIPQAYSDLTSILIPYIESDSSNFTELFAVGIGSGSVNNVQEELVTNVTSVHPAPCKRIARPSIGLIWEMGTIYEANKPHLKADTEEIVVLFHTHPEGVRGTFRRTEEGIIRSYEDFSQDGDMRTIDILDRQGPGFYLVLINFINPRFVRIQAGTKIEGGRVDIQYVAQSLR